MSRNTFLPGNKFGRGRPKGIRNKSNAAQQLLLDQQVTILNRCLLFVTKGNTRLHLWLLNHLPWHGTTSQKLKLPPIETIDDVIKARSLIIQAFADQRFTAADAQALTVLVEGSQRLIENKEYERRLQELERQTKPS